MRFFLAAVVASLLAGCGSREEGGLVTPLESGARVAVVPIADAIRRRVQVFGTGKPMTDAVVVALRAAGFDPVLVQGDHLPEGVRYVLAGAFIEWEPDMSLELDASDAATREMVSHGRVIIGRQDIGAGRFQCIQPLASSAVHRLMSQPIDPRRPSGNDWQQR